MNRKIVRGVFLAGLLAGAGLLTGCADGGGSGDDLLVIVNGGPSPATCTSPVEVLDGLQCSITTLVDDIAAIVNGTPLEGFVQCLDPLGNDVVQGPDSVLNTLLIALSEQSATPADFEAAIMDLATALASLGTNLPAALQALGGDPDAIAYCNGGAPPGPSDPLDPNQLAGLCAIPTIGPQLVTGLGGVCP